MAPTNLVSRLAQLESPTVDDLGGSDFVARGASDAVANVYADRLVAAIAREPALTAELSEVIFGVLEANPYPFVVAAAAWHARHIDLQAGAARQLQGILLSRAGRHGSVAEAEMATECLAAAFLFATDGRISRLAFLGRLDDVQPGDPPIYVRRVARLAGLSWLWDGSPDVMALLQRLIPDDEAGDQALYELGLIQLDLALRSDDEDALLAGLELATKRFEQAAIHNADLMEAQGLGAALRATLLFCSDAASHEVEQKLQLAADALGDRLRHLDRSSLRGWLRPRVDIETSWYQLILFLRGLAEALEDRSWLRAVPVLEQIGKVRRALIGVASSNGDALRGAITDRFARSFLAKEGLRAHLQAWAEDTSTSEIDRAEARTLLDAVGRARDAPLGKGLGPAASPTAAGQKRSHAGSDLERPKGSNLVAATVVNRAWETTAKTEEAYVSIDSALDGHPDYIGIVRDDTQLLMMFLIQFLSHCLDVGSRMAEGLFDFLFDMSVAKPLEVELQMALYTCLRLQVGGFPQHSVVFELADVAAGRADIAIIRPNWRIVIEVKRELDDASREGIRRYLGQAASYVLTGPRIGLLVVLDLCSQKDWALTLGDNCWVERVRGEADTTERLVIVVRVPGMRTVPSAVRTPGFAVAQRSTRKKRLSGATSRGARKLEGTRAHGDFLQRRIISSLF